MFHIIMMVYMYLSEMKFLMRGVRMGMGGRGDNSHQTSLQYSIVACFKVQTGVIIKYWFRCLYTVKQSFGSMSC